MTRIDQRVDVTGGQFALGGHTVSLVRKAGKIGDILLFSLAHRRPADRDQKIGECPYFLDHGLMRQMRCAYSRMLRSLEKMPMLRVLRHGLALPLVGLEVQGVTASAPPHRRRSPGARRTARPRSATGPPPACRRRGCRREVTRSTSFTSRRARIRAHHLGRRIAAAPLLDDLVGGEPEDEDVAAPTCSRISMFAPSRVPMVSAPFSDSFMLPVPDASMPPSRSARRGPPPA